MKEVYAQRKETVERLFGTAKENHGFRYTQIRKSPDRNESRAYICLHESEKTSKNESPEGLIRVFEVLIIGERYTFDEHNKKNVSSLLVKSVLSTVWGSRKAAFLLYNISLNSQKYIL